MLANKRQFKRIDYPLMVQFRPLGTIQYVWGETKNFSREGVLIETNDYSFSSDDSLELLLKFPQKMTSLTVFGDVMWRCDNGKSSHAGVKFRFQDDNIQGEMIENLSSGNVLLKYIISSKDIHDSTGQRRDVDPGSQSADHQVQFSMDLPKSGLIKQYDERTATCAVTFRVKKEMAPDAECIAIAGDFNEWDTSSTPMTRLENGDFQLTLFLPCTGEYRYRFLIDGVRWESDIYADKYLPNEYGSDDSVVVL